MARLSPLYALLTAVALSASVPSQAQQRTQPQAQAQGDRANCQAFANFGGIVADYILPISLRDFAAMNSGKDQQKVQQFMSKVDRELTAADKQTFDRLGEDNAVIFEEAATDFAINLVLDGHGANRQNITAIMQQECTQVTSRRILDIQRQSYQTEPQTR